MDVFANFKLSGNDEDFELIGRVYEYFIGEFASAEGKRGGEFYTHKPVVDTLIKMIESTKGSTLPACCILFAAWAMLRASAGRISGFSHAKRHFQFLTPSKEI